MSQFKAASVVLKISQLITQIKCLFKLLINLLIREKIVSAFNYYVFISSVQRTSRNAGSAAANGLIQVAKMLAYVLLRW